MRERGRGLAEASSPGVSRSYIREKGRPEGKSQKSYSNCTDISSCAKAHDTNSTVPRLEDVYTLFDVCVHLFRQEWSGRRGNGKISAN